MDLSWQLNKCSIDNVAYRNSAKILSPIIVSAYKSFKLVGQILIRKFGCKL